MKYIQLILDVLITITWIVFAYVVAKLLLPDLAKMMGDSRKYTVNYSNAQTYANILLSVPIINGALYIVKYGLKIIYIRGSK